MSKNKIFLVQGVFFQRGVSFGLAEKEGIGLAATIKNTLNYAVFTGVIFEDKESGELTGTMQDRFGYSDLSEIKITETEFSYCKKYINRNDLIFYSFTQEDDKWVGDYQGEATGSGQSNCLLIEVDPSFFQPKN